MANKRKKKASKGPRARKVASKRIASVYEARTGGDTIHRAVGRAAHQDAVRRGSPEASEGCGHRMLQERDESRQLAANATLESHDAKRKKSEMETMSICFGESAQPWAAEAVTIKAEAERLRAELTLQAERQHRAWKE